MAKKQKKRQTIGKMSNSRVIWQINPTNRIKRGKSKSLSRAEAKRALRSGKWDHTF